VDREKEISKFVPEPYWIIRAYLEGDIIADHRKLERSSIKNNADEILADCQGKDSRVVKVKLRESKKIRHHFHLIWDLYSQSPIHFLVISAQDEPSNWLRTYKQRVTLLIHVLPLKNYQRALVMIKILYKNSPTMLHLEIHR
jgi:hypothetical protein